MTDIISRCNSIVDGTADKTLLHNNANKNAERINVMKTMIAGEVIKEYAHQVLPKTVLDAHKAGEIHFHDMDESPMLPMFNCSLVDLRNMLEHGFNMGNAEIETPKSIGSAAAITVQIIANVAGVQYGGISINRIDEILAPYVTLTYYEHLESAKEFMGDGHAAIFAKQRTLKDVDRACQAMEYEINTLYTSQGQTPFVTFGFGLGTSWQAKSIQRGILQERIKGLGKLRKTAIFPKLVYMLDEGVNMKQGDPNMSIRKLALQCAARRNYPDVLSMPKLREENGGCTPMGCRSFLHKWLDNDGNEVWDGRNNLGVVSINIPRIAIEADGNEDKFFKLLQERIEVSKVALDARADRLRGVKARVAPILYCEGALGHRLQPDDDIWQLFENGRASISLGYIGLHEAANALFKTTEGALRNPQMKEFQIKVVQTLRDATEKWKAEGELGYGLYATPSESLCDRFCRLDVDAFGIINGVTNKGYYTNSFHLDVEEKVAPTTKIDFESDFHPISNSGRITYTEVPHISRRQEDLLLTFIDTTWKYASDKVAYFGTNCVIDYCHACDSDIDAVVDGGSFSCPECGNNDINTLEITKRVCGYLGNPNTRGFIAGKQEEVRRRVKHKQDS